MPTTNAQIDTSCDHTATVAEKYRQGYERLVEDRPLYRVEWCDDCGVTLRHERIEEAEQ